MRGLEKNRVFDIGKIERLNRAGCGMLSTGSSVCEICDSAVGELEGLVGQVPGEARSAALIQSLSQVKRPLAKPEYEYLNLSLGRTLGKLSSAIPACDAEGAGAMEASTQKLQISTAMIRELMGYIELAGTDIHSADFQKELERYSSSWQETKLALDEVMSYSRTLLKGLPSYVEFYGDPVNMATGNFTYCYTDLVIRGTLPLKFTRFYNAMDKNDGALGRGWIHNWETRLIVEEKSLTLIHEDGREEPFYPKDEKNYKSSRDEKTEIILLGETFCQRREDNLTLLFDREGHLICMMNDERSLITLLYEEGKLTRIQAETGDYFALSYNERGLLAEVTDHTGRKVLFTYDKKKLTGAADPEGQVMRYSYGKNGRVERILDKRDIPVLENTYDEHRRITGQTFPDGGVMTYRYIDERNRICVTEQNGNQITYIRDDQFRNIRTEYEDGSEQYTYDDKNNCTSYTDKRNNTTTYDYDEEGRLTAVTDPLANTRKTFYDEEGRPVKLLEPDGSAAICHYDEKGRLTQICNPLGHVTVLTYKGAGRRPETIILPDQGEMKLSYDLRGNITSIKYPDERRIKYVYDRLGRVIQSVDGEGNITAYTYDGLDRLIKVTREDGKERTYEYNPMGEAVKIVDFDGYPSFWEYNELNKPESHTDKEGRTTRITYDKMWNPAQITDPEGSETTYAYDHLNRLARVTDPLGRSTGYTYDPNGNRTAILYPDGTKKVYEYDELNRVITETDERGGVIRTQYDSVGRIVKTTDQAGGETIYVYDGAGNKIKEISPAGEAIVYTYTPLGKVETITYPGGRVESYSYQRGGKLLKHCKGDGTWESYAYDRAGNILSKEAQDGTLTEYGYDCLGRVSRISINGILHKTYNYDAMGNILAMEDARGNITRYQYSPEGNLTGVIDPEGNKVLYTYNGRDELTGILQLTEEDSVPDKDLWEAAALNNNHSLHLTLFQRNAAGQIETVTDALGRKEHYRYDEMGRVISRIDREGKETAFAYYSGGALKEAAYPDGKSVLLSYDALNRLNRVKDWLGEICYERDGEGRITRVTDYQGDQTCYGWNADGTRKYLKYSDGTRVDYEYDELARLAAIKSGNFTVSCQYDEQNRLMECSRGNGIKTLYRYDDTGLISALTHIGDTGVIEQFAYRYDQAGNPIWIQRQSGEPGCSFTHEYTYDRNNRLIKVIEDSRLLREYTYDGYGNRTAVTRYGEEEKTLYHYNSLNQLVEAGDRICAYNLKGEFLTEKDGEQEKLACRYDSLGRMTHVFREGELTEQNEYSGLGYRSLSHFPKGQETVSYCIDHTDDYAHILMEKGEAQQTYLWKDHDLCGLPGVEAYVLTDAFHTPVQLTDKNGKTRNAYLYDEYGVLEKSREEIPLSIGYTGYLKEKKENLYYAGAREYYGESGSFLTKDQSCYIDCQNPGSINLYQYVQGNPLRYLDYDGHQCIEERDNYSRLRKMNFEKHGEEKSSSRATVEKINLRVTGIDILGDNGISKYSFGIGNLEGDMLSASVGWEIKMTKTIGNYISGLSDFWEAAKEVMPKMIKGMALYAVNSISKKSIEIKDKAIKSFYKFVPQKVDNKVVLNVYELWRHVSNMQGKVNVSMISNVPGEVIEQNAINNTTVLTDETSKSKSVAFYIEGEYIENQALWDTVKFGSGEKTSMSSSGCGVMATYNALLALGEGGTVQTVVELISEFEEDGILGDGGFGVSPGKISDCLEERGYDVSVTSSTDPQTINQLGEQSDTIIVTAYNDKENLEEMVHNVSITKDENGKYAIHNAYFITEEGKYGCKDNDKKGYDTLQEAIDNMSNREPKAICVIGISKPEEED